MAAAATTTVFVPHLDTQAGFRLSNRQVDPTKPTVVLINSMCTTAALFAPQFASARLLGAANLLAIEPLGHGATRCRGGDHFTYWDSALVALQVMEALGVEKAYALGTSQGGWIVARMALLRPDKVCCAMLFAWAAVVVAVGLHVEMGRVGNVRLDQTGGREKGGGRRQDIGHILSYHLPTDYD